MDSGSGFNRLLMKYFTFANFTKIVNSVNPSHGLPWKIPEEVRGPEVELLHLHDKSASVDIMHRDCPY